MQFINAFNLNLLANAEGVSPWISAGAWLSAAVAIVALIVSLGKFGSRPRLAVEIYSEVGEPNITVMQDAHGNSVSCTSIHYHLKVVNYRSRIPATKTTLLVRRVSKVEKGYVLPIPFSPNIPLTWQHHNHIPGPRTIGYGFWLADICTVYCDPVDFVTFTMQFFPFGFEPCLCPDRVYELEVVAISEECSSAPFKVRITWNGITDPNPEAMRSYLRIEAA